MHFKSLMHRKSSIMLLLILIFQAFSFSLFTTVHGGIFWKYDTDSSVVNVGVSADGNFTVAGTEAGNVFLLDGEGNLLWTYHFERAVAGVSISADGSRIAVTIEEYLGGSPDTYLFDTVGNVIWQKDLVEGIYPCDVTISPDAKYLVAGDTDDVFYFYDVSGSRIWTYTAADRVTAVSVSSDGEYAAAGSWDNTLYFFNKTGSLLWSKPFEYNVDAVSISPEGQYVAAGCPTLRDLWLFANNGSLLSQIQFQSSIRAVSVSANAERIAVGTYNTINVVNKTGSMILELETGSEVKDIAVTANGKFVAFGCGDYVRFLDVLPSSTITCVISSSEIAFSGSITVSGNVTPPNTGAEVTLTYTKPDGSILKRTITINQFGSYSDTFTPGILGAWTVQASWVGDEQYAGSESLLQSFTVGKTHITCDAQIAVFLGDSLIVNGSISPPISGAEVKLEYKLIFQDSMWHGEGFINVTRTAITSADGFFADTFVASDEGRWEINASWAGDVEHMPCQTLVYFAVNPASQINLLSTTPITLYWHQQQWYCDHGKRDSQLLDMVAPTSSESATVAFDPDDYSYLGHGHYQFEGIHTSPLSESVLIETGLWNFSIWAAAREPNEHFSVSLFYWDKNHEANLISSWTTEYFNSTSPDAPTQFTYSFNLPAKLIPKESCLGFIIYNCRDSDVKWFFDSTLHPSHLTLPSSTEVVNYTLTIMPTTGGNTSPVPSTYTYLGGTEATVTAISQAGYSFDHWELDGVNIGSANPYTVTMNANHTLRAVFAQVTYTLTISAGTGGTTNPAPGTYNLNSGSSQSVLATASTGYAFDQWMLNGANAGNANPMSVTMNNNHALQAVFTLSTISLNVVAGTGGTVSPSGAQTLNVGQTYQFNANPIAGYEFDQWDLNGQSQGSSNPLMLVVTEAMAEQTLTALFTTSTPTPPSSLTASAAPPSVTASTGESATFSVNVSGGTSPYTYQWYEGTSTMSGETSAQLTVSPSSAGSNTYYCAVTDSDGTTANSNTVTLTVTTSPIDSPSPPASPSPTPSPSPDTRGFSLPMEVIYIAVGIVAAIAIAGTALVLKKRQKRTSKAFSPPPPPRI